MRLYFFKQFQYFNLLLFNKKYLPPLKQARLLILLRSVLLHTHNKNIKMSDWQAPTHVYKHVHLHYHYDVKDKNFIEPKEKYSTKTTLTSRQSHIFPEKSSWKNHINPQITRRYQQISVNQSFQQTYTPKASRLSCNPKRQWSNIQNDADGRHSTYSRQQLFQQISKYQQYLKKRSASNLYVPNVSSKIKYGYKSIQNLDNADNQHGDFQYKQKIPSLQTIRLRKQSQGKRYNESNFYRTDSNILNEKQCESTTARDQYQIIRQSEIKQNDKGNSRYNKKQLQNRSEVRTNENNPLVTKAKITLNHIQTETPKYEQENSNFSLFQRYPKKDSLKYSSQANQQATKQEQARQKYEKINIKTLELQNAQLLNQSDALYKYKLMRQQCNYLRSRFIEHIQNSHNIKI